MTVEQATAARNGTEAAGLDALLADAALGPLRRWVPGRAGAKAAVKLAVRPGAVARRSTRLTADLARIAIGRSKITPDKRDRRFKDPAWEHNPLFHRLAQAYLAAGRTVDGLICDADLDWASERRVRFAAENLLDALAPTNAPLTNPAAIKAAVDTGGLNFVRGGANLVRDMSRSPRIPTMVDRSAFDVGRNVAASPGAVVLRTPVLELLQYDAQTPQVRRHPLVVVPPMINKYYVADLAPGRSMIEHAVGLGQTAFAISWRNPDEHQAEWNLDTYAGAVLEALDAAEGITGSERSHVLGLCAGGIVLSSVVAVLAARGEQDRIAGLTLGVCVLDNRAAGTASAFMDPATAALAVADSARRGYLDGRALAGMFAWLRPNDLVWNYWVSNYLLGKDPPAFDILYWNADTTNMPGRAASRLRAHRARQPAGGAGRAGGVGNARRPVERHGRHVRRRGHRGPHHAVGELLPQCRPARLPPPVRVVHQWPHRRHGQPAGQRQGVLPAQRRPARGPGRMAARRHCGARQLVGGLGGLARPAVGRRARRPGRPRRRRASAARAGARHLRARVAAGASHHRFAISAAVFEPVLEHYAPRSECILYDHRSSARTRAARSPTSMPSRRRTPRGLPARAEPVTRAFGLPAGALRGSLAGLMGERILRARRAGRTHVALDRRAGPAARRDPRDRDPRDPAARAGDRRDVRVPRDLYGVMAEHELLGLGFPAAHGGRCESEASWCAWVEELAKISGTVSLMAAYVKLASLPLLLAGTDEQQRRVIPALISGEQLGSFALSEPDVGSDPAGLQTRAERRGDKWIINGRKRFIGNAGLADIYVVFARTGDPGPRGVSTFLVDGHAPGVSSQKLRTMGMPGWQLGRRDSRTSRCPPGT
jgi:polyhydroxyalkanoate synthase